jgi:hypothetical protein
VNTVLWILTGLLAAVALLGGSSKTFLSKARLDAMDGSWTGAASAASVKLLGIVELAAAAGLILPAVLGIAPVLVPVTALCWAVLMVGAVITHAWLHQAKLVALTLGYLAIAVVVAWGRFALVPFGS